MAMASETKSRSATLDLTDHANRVGGSSDRVRRRRRMISAGPTAPFIDGATPTASHRHQVALARLLFRWAGAFRSQRQQRSARRPSSGGNQRASKGAEVEDVAVATCDDWVFPSQDRIDQISGCAVLDDVWETGPQLLNVAPSRARDNVQVLAAEPGSESLEYPCEER